MAEGQAYVIWGSAGHAKVLASLIARRRGSVVALFDNNASTVSALDGVPLFIGEEGFQEWAAQQSNIADLCGLAAIGGARGTDRLMIQALFRRHGLRLAPIVHPDASVCETAILGEGTQVLALAVVAADAQIGVACIINHRAAVDHESILGDGVHLAPGATLCGCVRLGSNVMIGAGSVVLPRVTIGENTIVGAGSIVTKDLPNGIVAYGNPARIVRNRTDDE